MDPKTLSKCNTAINSATGLTSTPHHMYRRPYLHRLAHAHTHTHTQRVHDRRIVEDGMHAEVVCRLDGIWEARASG
eukprot:711490-Amphidinium_carterae.1